MVQNLFETIYACFSAVHNSHQPWQQQKSIEEELPRLSCGEWLVQLCISALNEALCGYTLTVIPFGLAKMPFLIYPV